MITAEWQTVVLASLARDHWAITTPLLVLLGLSLSLRTVITFIRSVFR